MSEQLKCVIETREGQIANLQRKLEKARKLKQRGSIRDLRLQIEILKSANSVDLQRLAKYIRIEVERIEQIEKLTSLRQRANATA